VTEQLVSVSWLQILRASSTIHFPLPGRCPSRAHSYCSPPNLFMFSRALFFRNLWRDRFLILLHAPGSCSFPDYFAPMDGRNSRDFPDFRPLTYFLVGLPTLVLSAAESSAGFSYLSYLAAPWPRVFNALSGRTRIRPVPFFSHAHKRWFGFSTQPFPRNQPSPRCPFIVSCTSSHTWTVLVDFSPPKPPPHILFSINFVAPPKAFSTTPGPVVSRRCSFPEGYPLAFSDPILACARVVFSSQLLGPLSCE